MSERMSMVRWFDPKQLLRTGTEILISSLFARYMDRRQIQAMTAGADVFYEFTGPKMIVWSLPPVSPRLAPAVGGTERPAAAAPVKVAEMDTTPSRAAGTADGDFWLDYVADVGDGWDSTYAIASALAQPLTLGAEVTRPGQLLVFGGDEVYPVASAQEYDRRLVAAYSAAFAAWRPDNYPVAFAVPGNHDWYDNLVSFSRLFCSSAPFAGPDEPPVGRPDAPRKGCYTPQQRGYFAMRLPHDWWLLGVDVQLNSDIDGSQYDFFRRVNEVVGARGQVILCVPEPHWVYAEVMPTDRAAASKNALAVLEELLGDKVRVFVAGDAHHYCRYESAEPADGARRSHKITAGGGGAFLHPTHGVLDVRQLENGKYAKKTCFPSTGRSRGLAVRNLLFAWTNAGFGVLPAVVYVALLWLIMPLLQEPPEAGAPGLYAQGPLEALGWLFGGARTWNFYPTYLHLRILMIALLPVLLFAFYLFTDLKTRLGAVVAAALHGGAHYFSALFFAWLASAAWYHWQVAGPGRVFDPGADVFWTWPAFLFATALAFAAGWLIGSTIMGVYLCVVSLLGSHWNAAFSALRIEDWKNFLRMKIDGRGRLTIYPVGIEAVPRTHEAGPTGPLQVAGKLIDVPIEVDKAGAEAIHARGQ